MFSLNSLLDGGGVPGYTFQDLLRLLVGDKLALSNSRCVESLKRFVSTSRSLIKQQTQTTSYLKRFVSTSRSETKTRTKIKSVVREMLRASANFHEKSSNR